MDHAFRFDFVNDKDDDDDKSDQYLVQTEKNKISKLAGTEVPRLYTLQEMIPTLPDQISYTAVDINTQSGRTIRVLRRELFDIRAQLMAEDPLRDQNMIEGLSKDDITPGLYEGGFKTWECSVDLASYVASEPQITCGIKSRPWHIIELGAGSALPSLVLFNLRNDHQTAQIPKPPPFQMTLADYNPSVLRLATIPNILINHEIQQADATGTTIPTTDYKSLEQNLSLQNIQVTTISGPWSDAFNNIVHIQPILYQHPPSASPHSQPQTLVLASETIYSPETIPAFVSTLVHLLTTAVHYGRSARALVAAKRFYFGVGGGVDEFVAVLPKNGLRAAVVWETEGEGVGRAILEVTLVAQAQFIGVFR